VDAGGGGAFASTAPYRPDDPGVSETSDDCSTYKAQSTVLTACRTVYPNGCPADLPAALGAITPQELVFRGS
jgi:hypothetical protein